MALFTAETARLNAAKSAEMRRMKRDALKAAVISGPPATAPDAAQSDDYGQRRLARVRAQLDRVDMMIACETDPAKLDRLASTSARLEEQERRLSNRSLPPTLKAPARPRSKSGAPAPLD